MEDNSTHELNLYHMSILESYKRVKNKENLFNALKILCQNKAKINITIKNENDGQTPKNNQKIFNNNNNHKINQMEEKKKWNFIDTTKYITKYEQDSDDRDEPKKNVYDNYNYDYKKQFNDEKNEYNEYNDDNKKLNMKDKFNEKNRCNLCDRPYDSNFWILHKCKHNFCEDCQIILIENSENILNHCPLTECNSEIIKNDKEFIARKINKIFSCYKCQKEKPLNQAIILHDCKHLFCIDCFKKFVKNGEITDCPLTSCMKKINKKDFNFIRGIFF